MLGLEVWPDVLTMQMVNIVPAFAAVSNNNASVGATKHKPVFSLATVSQQS
jgi:hypothetical protein